jgi:hypothetical protein
MILYDDLQRDLTTGNVCAFVGAGLSAGAGLPGWYDLIAELSARIGYDLPPPKYATGDALIDAAQAYVNRQGLYALISHLKDRFDTTGVQPTTAHRALARLPISLVFTANFDDLLERAFRDAGKRVEVVMKDSSIPFMRRGPDTVNIVKLYGDLDQPDTIVLARQQYESYFLQRPQMVKLLETELARSDTLYLGWSGSDPYFKLVFGELLSRFGGMMRPGYAVMFDVTDAQRDELARKQIRLVDLPPGDRTAALAAWLESLAGAALKPNPQVPSGASLAQTGQVSAAPQAANPVMWNRSAIRQLLGDAFNDEELTTLCFDHFPTVYEAFGSGMSKGDKILRLLDYCVRREQVAQLLTAVQTANPAQYRRYEDRLRS